MTQKKAKVSTSSQTEKFRSELEDMYTASLITGLNAQVITEPGWGKTKLSLAMGKQVYNGGTLLLECNPALSPDRIRGITDMKALMEGEYRRIVDDTPYADDVKVVILDEVARLSDIAYDLLIHATNDYVRPIRPLFWGTSNFAVKGQRTEAFRDRFALNFIPSLTLDKQSVINVVTSEDISTWQFGLPDKSQVNEIRNLIPSRDAQYTVADMVVELYRAITESDEGKRFLPGLNPRRVEAWGIILMRATMYYTGNNDFKAVDGRALRLLRFGYPVLDKSEYQQWTAIATSVSDPAETAIEAIRVKAYETMQKIGTSSNPNERQAKMIELGKVKAEAEQDLSQYGEDPRAQQALGDLQDMFIRFARGEH